MHGNARLTPVGIRFLSDAQDPGTMGVVAEGRSELFSHNR